MLLWLLFALLTAAVIVVVAWPLARGEGGEPRAPETDIAVYKDQIAEIARDKERGLISDTDAEAARAEVGRRLLRAADAASVSSAKVAATDQAARRRGRLALAIAILIPLVAIGFYLPLGAPGLPGQPVASRPHANPRDASFGELIAKVEARLRDHPEDAQGWDVIAPVYLRLGRYDDAADAFRRAIALKGETEARLMGLADATVASNGGIVSEDARKLLDKVVALNRDHPGARFLLALGKEQDGRLADAAKDYREILASAPPEAPWRRVVADRLASVTGETKPDEKGPDAEQIEATRNMTPEQRAQMIDSMVSGLADRLKKDGRDLQGWLRLARAYKVLGKIAEAKEAIANARKTFAGEEKSLAEIAAAEKELGL
ncbi:MAG: c-type cytochrome biogenesis protein CcmI [Hyphomicrobiaceae bacterium]|nr:MAG: c-type cytochrome biogenesis protein CcmI [Hyphomicrobiaceae bacterium]